MEGEGAFTTVEGASLMKMAAQYKDDLLRVELVNPENGASLFPSIGFGVDEAPLHRYLHIY